jgi:hypothetical protein
VLIVSRNAAIEIMTAVKTREGNRSLAAKFANRGYATTIAQYFALLADPMVMSKLKLTRSNLTITRAEQNEIAKSFFQIVLEAGITEMWIMARHSELSP